MKSKFEIQKKKKKKKAKAVKAGERKRERKKSGFSATQPEEKSMPIDAKVPGAAYKVLWGGKYPRTPLHHRPPDHRYLVHHQNKERQEVPPVFSAEFHAY